MKILALDPAAVTGIAWMDTDVPNSLRTTSVDLKRAGELGAQHLKLESILENQIATHGADRIASENAGFGSKNPRVQAMHNERLGIIRSVAAKHGIEIVLFVPTTIKSYATGSGNADKPQMIAAAGRLLGLRNLTSDEADAAWICHLAAHPKHWPKDEPKVRKPRAVRAPKKAKRLF